MTLIFDQLKKDLNDIDKAIEEKTTSLCLAMTESVFNGVMKDNHEMQEKLSKEIKEIKIKKFKIKKKKTPQTAMSTSGEILSGEHPDNGVHEMTTNPLLINCHLPPTQVFWTPVNGEPQNNETKAVQETPHPEEKEDPPAGGDHNLGIRDRGPGPTTNNRGPSLQSLQ